MEKKLLYIFLFLSINFLSAQCVEEINGGTNVAISAEVNQYVSQSFKMTCAGQLTTVAISLYHTGQDPTEISITDDSGNVLGVLENVTINTGIQTFDFTSQNISFAAETTYKFRVKIVSGIVIQGANSNLYPKGSVFLNDNAYTNLDLINWKVTVSGSLGVEEVSENSNKVTVYPNPVVNSHLFVKIPKGTNKCDYTLYSVEGKMVKKGQIDGNNNKIDISELEKGMYIVKVIRENKTYNSTFIVE